MFLSLANWFLTPKFQEFLSLLMTASPFWNSVVFGSSCPQVGYKMLSSGRLPLLRPALMNSTIFGINAHVSSCESRLFEYQDLRWDQWSID